ncbi:MAG: YitT family protein [Desulfatitalea sp.]|nr:YitT family protein [Desulfatitalea sp.]NNJ99202.1 YitT family protein [Desulfatitalea sp.]
MATNTFDALQARPAKMHLMPVLKNLALISGGCIVFVYGMNAVMIPAKLFSGGLTGLAILFKYNFAWADVGTIYFLLNLPLLVVGWLHIGRRFVAYSLFGIAFFSLATILFQPQAVTLADPLLSALLSGVICGAGSGLVLRSMGSAGGLDILSIYLNKRWGLRIGTISFGANAMVILLGIWSHDLSAALYATIVLFVSGYVINAVISGFNARISVMIISKQWEAIADEILGRLNRGVTYLDGQGAYSSQPRKIILTITTVIELPKFKEMIFKQDPNAFVVVNNTLEVLGQRHGRMRVY